MIHLEMKRCHDKSKFFEFEFSTFGKLNNFLHDFFEADVLKEKLELRIWETKDE